MQAGSLDNSNVMGSAVGFVESFGAFSPNQPRLRTSPSILTKEKSEGPFRFAILLDKVGRMMFLRVSVCVYIYIPLNFN